MNKIMRVVLVEPGKKAVVKAIDGSLEGMQKTVGGYIEAIALDEHGTCLVCNESGKIDDLPLNRVLGTPVMNIRIRKELRNQANRAVNCDSANLRKTVDASDRQAEAIEYIRDHLGFDHLPPSLREIAQLRLNYREASLIELGEMLDPPVGKSGVNHRLRRLLAIYQELTGAKPENP